jgi:hypothetical protein
MGICVQDITQGIQQPTIITSILLTAAADTKGSPSLKDGFIFVREEEHLYIAAGELFCIVSTQYMYIAIIEGDVMYYLSCRL